MGFQMTATETYDAETDVYRQFIDECLEEDPTGDGQIEATDLYTFFCRWYQDGLHGHRSPTGTAFGKEVAKEGLRKEKRGTVKYVRIKFRDVASLGTIAI